MRGPIFPLPQYVFVAWCLDQHKDKFTFITNYLTKSSNDSDQIKEDEMGGACSTHRKHKK
jgi:hypothetical protein